VDEILTRLGEEVPGQEVDHGLPWILVFAPRLHLGHHPDAKLAAEPPEEIVSFRFGRDEPLAGLGQVVQDRPSRSERPTKLSGRSSRIVSMATRSMGVRAKGEGRMADSTPAGLR